MGKLDTIITLSVLGVVGVGAYYFYSGLKGTGISLNPMDWGKELGKSLQDAWNGGQARNSDGSLITPNSPITESIILPGGQTITKTFPHGTTEKTIDDYFKQFLPYESDLPQGYTGSYIRGQNPYYAKPPNKANLLSGTSTVQKLQDFLIAGGKISNLPSTSSITSSAPTSPKTLSSSSNVSVGRTVLDLTNKTNVGGGKYVPELKVFVDATGKIVGKKAVGVWK